MTEFACLCGVYTTFLALLFRSSSAPLPHYSSFTIQQMSDREQQRDELTVIESIYPELLHYDGENTISLREGDVRISIVLPEAYPSTDPLQFEVGAPCWKFERRAELHNALSDIVVQNLGMPVLFPFASTLKEYAGEEFSKESSDEPLDTSCEAPDDEAHIYRKEKEKVTENIQATSIVSGEVFCDRKSSFQAHFARVHSKEEVEKVMETLLSNNKIARATHNITAYRLKVIRDGREINIHDCNDDGETGASAKMLQILERMIADNCIVVVTRWYGGVHLGPDRFRIINNLTRQILVDNGIQGPKK